MRVQRVSPDVFPTEGRAPRGRGGRRSRSARGSRVARDARARTIVDGIRAYLAADIASVRSVVTEDVTLRYIDRDGNPVVVTGVDAVIRLVPGVVGDEASVAADSFVEGLLDCPHYTRPADFRGMTVPDVLLSGHHAEIARWRRDQQLARTAQRRPDLLGRVTEQVEKESTS